MELEKKQRFYVDVDGNFKGSYYGGEPPKGLTEIDGPSAELKAPHYNNGAWGEYVPSSDPRDHNLGPRKFNKFLALYDYDDAIEAILKALKSAPLGSPSREVYAQIKSDVLSAKGFRFQVILDLIGSPDLASLIPKDVDVSEETLAARWMLAKDY